MSTFPSFLYMEISQPSTLSVRNTFPLAYAACQLYGMLPNWTVLQPCPILALET